VIRIRTLVLVLGLLLTTASANAAATFPGRNGLILFQHETPAGDHTQTDLYTVAPDGSGLHRLTNTPNQNEFGGRWSASGGRIVFWRTPAPFGFGDVWVMDASGSSQRQLTHGFDARDPTWAPGGAHIAFTRNEGANANLWIMRSDGTGLRRLTSGPALDFEPAWSPDGTRIAFTRGYEQGDAGDIYVLQLKTRKLIRITRSPAYDHQVSWGPGGGRLLFERDYGQSSSIIAASAAGGSVVHLTGGKHFDLSPVSSPDNRFVIFSSDRGGGFPDLWLMNRDGAHLHRFLALPYAESVPDWQPRPGS
jgi:TolB protein